jgi:hypothetical protein
MASKDFGTGKKTGGGWDFPWLPGYRSNIGRDFQTKFEFLT